MPLTAVNTCIDFLLVVYTNSIQSTENSMTVSEGKNLADDDANI